MFNVKGSYNDHIRELHRKGRIAEKSILLDWEEGTCAGTIFLEDGYCLNI